MNRTLTAVRNIISALGPLAFDIGVLSERGMLPGLSDLPASTVLDRVPLLKYQNAHGAHIYIRPAGQHRFTVLGDLNREALNTLTADGFEPCAVVETSAGNFQAWLKHAAEMSPALATFAAQTLAVRYRADPNAAEWRRFGRLPGFTSCKPKYRKENGHYPFVLLRSCTGKQFLRADSFLAEIIQQYGQRKKHREARMIACPESLSPQRGPRYSHFSLERFRALSKYEGRPAAADIAFCVAASVECLRPPSRTHRRGTTSHEIQAP